MKQKILAMEENDLMHGINALIFNEKGELLLGKRAGKRSGAGQWSLVGGKQKVGETIYETMARELKEELGITVSQKHMSVVNIADCIDSESVHFLQIGVRVAKYSGEIKNKEPDKCSELKFFPLNKLPNNLFFATKPNIKLFTRLQFYNPKYNYVKK